MTYTFYICITLFAVFFTIACWCAIHSIWHSSYRSALLCMCSCIVALAAAIPAIFLAPNSFFL